MPARIDNEIGRIVFSDNAIAALTGLTVVECYGIVGMAPVRSGDGIIELLKRENLSKGVQVSSDGDNSIMIDIYIIVQYGISINAVCTSVIETVSYKLQSLMNIKPAGIHVHVQGVRV